MKLRQKLQRWKYLATIPTSHSSSVQEEKGRRISFNTDAPASVRPVFHWQKNQSVTSGQRQRQIDSARQQMLARAINQRVTDLNLFRHSGNSVTGDRKSVTDRLAVFDSQQQSRQPPWNLASLTSGFLRPILIEDSSGDKHPVTERLSATGIIQSPNFRQSPIQSPIQSPNIWHVPPVTTLTQPFEEDEEEIDKPIYEFGRHPFRGNRHQLLRQSQVTQRGFLYCFVSCICYYLLYCEIRPQRQTNCKTNAA